MNSQQVAQTGFQFKPEDFKFLNFRLSEWCLAPNEVAGIANEILQAHLATLPRVYGWFDGDGACRFSELKAIGSDKGEATHRGVLWGITEIEKNCEHMPTDSTITSTDRWLELGGYIYCKHCGVKLKAKWEKV